MAAETIRVGMALRSALVLVLVAVTSAQPTPGCTTIPSTRTDGNDITSANVTSVGACCAACQLTRGCTFFVFVHSRDLCWLKSSGSGATKHDPDCTSGSNNSPMTLCDNNDDCNQAGECVSGKCQCDAPFHGPYCANFTLYSYKPSEGGLQIPTGNTTWGGSVVQADDGSYHMFAAMMTGNGTLSTWLHQSVVAHAVSKTNPQGPYVFSDVALAGRGPEHWDGVTCHNPDVKRTPDGLYVIYYMGSSIDNNGSTNVEFNQRVGVAYSKSPYGPWSGRNVIVEPGPKGKWDDGFTTNPAPYIYPNGSVLLIYKARNYESSGGMLEGVAFANAWNTTYVKMTPDKPLDLPTDCEDAGIYRTTKGIFRMLTHCGCTGQYMWSLDGYNWNRTTPEVGWCDNISYTDGSVGNLATRQRPKWLVDRNGTATHVFTGVNRQGNSGMGHTWTMAAAVSKP